MFENQVESLWRDWYEKNRPVKQHWGRGLLSAGALVIAGIFVLQRSLVIGTGIIAAGIVCWMVEACIVCGKQGRLVESAREYSWRYGIYDTGRGKQFPFMHTRESYVMGGKLFQYEGIDIILYDTYYHSQNNEPGLLIEMIPRYKIGEGTPVWEKDHLEVPITLDIDERLSSFIEQLIRYQRSHNAYPKCVRHENRFYLYISHAAMGLIVDENGQLYSKTAVFPEGCWRAADYVVQTMDACFNGI